MKTYPSTIFMLSATDFAPGICSICGESVMIRFRDSSAGMKLGHCCLPFVVAAEAVLCDPKLGLRHPTGEETTQLPDH